MNKVRILVVDDHAVVRKAMTCVVDAEPDMEVVGEADDGSEACRQVTVLQPDLILMDLWMPNMTGEEATREIKRTHPEIKVLALTAQEDNADVCEVLEAGASGYVLKRAERDELVTAIRNVAGGKLYIDPRVENAVLDVLSHGNGRRTGENERLSSRELEVLRGIALGYTNKEVAARLELSVKTVETYKGRSMKKLRLRSRVDLIRLATKRGWINAAQGTG
jgi:DNA-binding NarL/FixJ family response regulator